jgi:hypothetical protein
MLDRDASRDARRTPRTPADLHDAVTVIFLCTSIFGEKVVIQLRRTLAASAMTVVAGAFAIAPHAHAGSATGSIGGTLTNASGVPLADVSVTIHPASGGTGRHTGRTDSAGHYSLAGLPPGRYTVEFRLTALDHALWAHHAGNEATATRFAVRAGENTVVDESTLPTGTLSVKFRSRATGQLVDAFCASVTGDFVVTKGCTDNGTVLLPELPVGEYAVLGSAKADPHDYGVGFPTVDVGQVTEVTVE